MRDSSPGIIGDGAEMECPKLLRVLVRPSPNAVADDSGSCKKTLIYLNSEGLLRSSCGPPPIAESAENVLWRVSRPAGDQLAQLAGNATIELQIGPEFHAHRNVPMFRADAHQPFEFRWGVHNDRPSPFSGPVVAAVKPFGNQSLQIRFPILPLRTSIR
jgi:hypothetical protein